MQYPSIEDSIHFTPVRLRDPGLCAKCQLAGYCRLARKLGLEYCNETWATLVIENIEKLVPVRLQAGYRPASQRTGLQRALDFYHQQDYEPAIRIVDDFVNHQKPGMPMLLRGLAYMRCGKYQAACSDLELFGTDSDLAPGYQLHLSELLDTCRAMMEMEMAIGSNIGSAPVDTAYC